MKREHPFLGSSYLKRGPNNYCLNCGGKIQISPSFNWYFCFFQPHNSKSILIGYTHKYNCLGDNNDEEYV